MKTEGLAAINALHSFTYLLLATKMSTHLRGGFPGGLFPGLGSWTGLFFQEAGMGKSQADLLRLPQVTKIRAAEFQPEGSTDKTSQEAQNSN